MIFLEILILLSTLFPIIHLFQAIFVAFKNKKQKKIGFDMINKFSILIPCYNEEDVIFTSIEGIKRLNYSNYEVIYINDGSSDDTFQALDKYLKLKQQYNSLQDENPKVLGFYKSTVYENFYVVDKLNGGKADSLNTGISFSNYELIVTLDADSVLEKNSLCIIDNTFSDEKVIAAGGVVHVLQSSFSPIGGNFKDGLIKLQALDYIKGFYIYKASLACEDALAIISGAFGIFKKSVLKEVGGYRNTLGEDIDITLRFQQYALRYKKTIKFIPHAICYSECPESWSDLFKQRIRWQKAFIDCLLKFSSFIVRSFMTKPVSFYLILEAFGVGITSSIFTIAMGLTALFSTSSLVLANFVFYYIISTIFNLIYSLIAIKISNLYCKRKYSIKYFITTLIWDVLFYRYVNILYYLSGTVLYFFNRKSWNKVKRSKRKYEFSQ
jgi:cellulose synthase/poly-beta-1,6-N-acetylglucosamine synthase-like glycosyltransferase